MRVIGDMWAYSWEGPFFEKNIFYTAASSKQQIFLSYTDNYKKYLSQTANIHLFIHYGTLIKNCFSIIRYDDVSIYFPPEY